jgi:hypothetical protein
VLRSTRRLEFVQLALEAKPTAYRNSQRLMKLATLLRAENIDNLEGVVWAMVARKALQVKVILHIHKATFIIKTDIPVPVWR